MDNKDGGEEDFSLYVVASDITVDAHAFGIGNSLQEDEKEEDEEWHECDSALSPLLAEDNDDFSDLEQLRVLELQGKDKAGRRILRIVGKYFPAPVISGERLKKYVYQKIFSTVPEGPFCILYMHTSVQKDENSPGVSILRWIYEELPVDYKDRLQVVYFLHPGIRSRLLLATLGRYFLSGGLYWKLKYINRVEFLWDNIRKGQVEIPEFVYEHDSLLENRPLMDYGIETDPLQLHDMPVMGSTYSRPAMRLD
uniref:CRAL-TRIO domain-containing protein n=1 Tax=Araucaria cunninghamii TaxID=56994 RepID=A0A0D6R7S5_ARACU